MIGKTINQYKILDKLGAGGMGVVYKAQDTKLDRLVALKFLPQNFSEDLLEKQRFVHEAKAASALDHPHICTIHEIAESEDGQLFIVMAYYDGESLKQKIKNGPMSFDDVREIAIQMAEGLGKAHSKGIVHRDIKPANIILTSDGIIKILDFGLAKLAGGTRLTRTGGTLGTVAYMSPEQSKGEDVDHRTDIWSFGVVLYEMLTGQLPFKGEYEQAVIYSILNEEPDSPGQLRGDIPDKFIDIIKKALKKNPEVRYNSAANLSRDLAEVSGLTAQKEGAQITPIQPGSQKVRIFLSYKRNAAPDQELASVIHDALAKDFDVFIDQNMSVGEHWVERIMSELQTG